jgi:hypothetical protein
VDDALGDGTEDEALHAGAVVGADDDQIGVEIHGELHEVLCRVAVAIVRYEACEIEPRMLRQHGLEPLLCVALELVESQLGLHLGGGAVKDVHLAPPASAGDLNRGIEGEVTVRFVVDVLS